MEMEIISKLAIKVVQGPGNYIEILTERDLTGGIWFRV